MQLLQALTALYPSGYYGGECALWAEKVAAFGPVGDSFSQKQAYVNQYGIIAPNILEIGRGFRAGDVIVSSEGTKNGVGNGHVAILLDPKTMAVAECNFSKNGKVAYGRLIPQAKIYGIIRAPLKIDLGVCNVTYCVMVNNQSPWAMGFLTALSSTILAQTGGKLNVSFYPLQTRLANWDYVVTQYPQDNQFYKIISPNWFDFYVKPLAGVTGNKLANAAALIVRPDEWQGASFGQTSLTELAWTDPTSSPARIQIKCAEHDVSPWYQGMPFINHALTHELAHLLYYVNGLDDKTHSFDSPTMRNLSQVFSQLDFNRLSANLN